MALTNLLDPYAGDGSNTGTSGFLTGDTFPEPGTPTPSGPQYAPVPNSPGMYYDPATGAVYGNPAGMGTPIPGAYYAVPGNTYNASTGQLSINGQPFNQNPNYTGPSMNLSDPNATFWNAAPVPAPVPTSPSAQPSGGTVAPPQTAGGGTVGSLLQPFTQSPPTYQPAPFTPIPTPTPIPAPTPIALPNVPAPDFPNIPAFAEPTGDQVRATPGYQFGLDQGRGQMEASAAARGVINTGGTLEDILKFGQNYADQAYQQFRQNSLDDYMTNSYLQYVQPWQAKMSAWQTIYPSALGVNTANAGAANAVSAANVGAINAANTANAGAANNIGLANATGANNLNQNNWLQNYNIFRNRQLDTFSYLYPFSQMGATVQ